MSFLPYFTPNLYDFMSLLLNCSFLLSEPSGNVFCGILCFQARIPWGEFALQTTTLFLLAFSDSEAAFSVERNSCAHLIVLSRLIADLTLQRSWLLGTYRVKESAPEKCSSCQILRVVFPPPFPSSNKQKVRVITEQVHLAFPTLPQISENCIGIMWLPFFQNIKSLATYPCYNILSSHITQKTHLPWVIITF